MTSAFTSFAVSLARDEQKVERVVLRLPERVPLEPVMETLRTIEAVAEVQPEDGQIRIAMHDPKTSLGVLYYPLQRIMSGLCAAAYGIRSGDFQVSFLFPP